MKYLVSTAIVLLAAAACASQIEKREAEPSVAYHSVYRTPAYPLSSYGPSFPTHYHKRSADAEPSTHYGYRTFVHTPPVYGGYGHSVHTLHKRSADAEPSRVYSHGTHFPVTYGGYYGQRLYKRSAEPEAEASYLSYPSYSPYSPVTPYYRHTLYKRSAQPEAEAEPSQGYLPTYSAYTPQTYYGGHIYKRSAQPEAEAEASQGYLPTYSAYTPLHYGGHIYKRSAQPEAEPSYVPSNAHYTPATLYRSHHY
ncbi:DNA-directed RNA polymerase II subunit RPB1-like isoform X3 [Penaeus japonicus]|uniref:DNA-directed RNA polymerase II subunit RPB1-like isoform X3 n=1 Tax=Penaeus japonicus TaxID=27405 RepID=UPI001C711D85|nr:DNA-directed RNA polymerase II subunit RPB1-like isoform X3 [Penaeus japonicus]